MAEAWAKTEATAGQFRNMSPANEKEERNK
jgi:hypothetical protein